MLILWAQNPTMTVRALVKLSSPKIVINRNDWIREILRSSDHEMSWLWQLFFLIVEGCSKWNWRRLRWIWMLSSLAATILLPLVLSFCLSQIIDDALQDFTLELCTIRVQSRLIPPFIWTLLHAIQTLLLIIIEGGLSISHALLPIRSYWLGLI